MTLVHGKGAWGSEGLGDPCRYPPGAGGTLAHIQPLLPAIPRRCQRGVTTWRAGQRRPTTQGPPRHCWPSSGLGALQPGAGKTPQLPKLPAPRQQEDRAAGKPTGGQFSPLMDQPEASAQVSATCVLALQSGRWASPGRGAAFLRQPSVPPLPLPNNPFPPQGYFTQWAYRGLVSALRSQLKTRPPWPGLRIHSFSKDGVA